MEKDSSVSDHIHDGNEGGGKPANAGKGRFESGLDLVVSESLPTTLFLCSDFSDQSRLSISFAHHIIFQVSLVNQNEKKAKARRFSCTSSRLIRQMN